MTTEDQPLGRAILVIEADIAQIVAIRRVVNREHLTRNMVWIEGRPNRWTEDTPYETLSEILEKVYKRAKNS